MTEIRIEVDQDGAAATARAAAAADHEDRHSTAVWVGEPDDEALTEFRDEIHRRCR